MSTTTTAAGLLTQVYADAVVPQLDNANYIYKVVEKDFETQPLNGKDIKFAVQYGRNSGIGNRPENTALPDAGNQSWDQATLTLRSIYGVVNVSGQLMELAKKGQSAFLDGASAELEGCMTDLLRDFNRQLHGTQEGVICQVNGAGSSSATLTLNNQEVGDTPARFLQGMKIDVKTTRTGGSTEVSGIEVINIVSESASAAVVTLASTQTWSDDSYVFRKGNQNYELYGLRSAIDDGGITDTYLGIQRTGTGKSYWKSPDFNNSGTPRNATEALFDDGHRAVTRLGVVADLAIMPFAVHKRLGAAMVAAKKFDVSSKKDIADLPGGYVGFTVNGLPLIADDDCSPGTLYIFKAKNFCLYSPFKPEFVKTTGSMWTKVSGYDTYEATLRYYVGLANKRPNASSVTRDLQ